MSKTDPCIRCGQWGHNSKDCKREVPPAEHTSAPFDATDRDMHSCTDCARRLGCKQRVPSITQPVRCAGFTPSRSSR